MNQESFSATGRRKSSVARVIITPGKGGFLVNGKEIDDYLKRQTLVEQSQLPFRVTDTFSHYDVICQTSGGGNAGQSGAIRLAISRALVKANAEHHSILRKSGLLTRDAREVERKKYGQPKARKRFQYSKR